MATSNEIKVQEMYVQYFGRPADPSGLDFWASAVDSNPSVLQQIQRDFSGSAEYREMYGNMSNREVVNEIYLNVFGRQGDTEGVNFWTSALDSNTLTINNVISDMVKHKGIDDSIVYNGRLAVATEFTDRLDTQAEIDAYLNPSAFGLASDFLGSIKDITTASMAINPDAIDAKIVEIVGISTAAEAPLILG